MPQVFFGSFIVGEKCSEKNNVVNESIQPVQYTPGSFTVASNALSVMTIIGLRNYNGNQEAIESGLREGDVYRNGNQLCIVHLE